MKEFFARLIVNFIFILSIVIAGVCGMGILISALECAWDILILCVILCPMGVATAVTIGETK